MAIANSRTKIVVTLGPASSEKETIRNIIIEGADVFRLNFSHGSHDKHKSTIDNIREVSKALNVEVAILADLQGPKIRIGELPDDGVMLENGKIVEITTEILKGDSNRFSIGYEHFARDVKEEEIILIDDGKIKLKVIETDGDKTVQCEVIFGGKLTSRKGVNLPDTNLSLPSLTEKDYEDAEFIVNQDIDLIALSFVRKVEDIIALKKLLEKHGSNQRVISKIEKPEAMKDIESIVDMSDGIMVARGDLGVELPFDHVPVIQKKIVDLCIRKSTPVIIATQMLESMVTNFNPTRAEANDVANAVLDGADALMLSAETSVGAFPVEAVKNMQKIISFTEDNAYKFHRDHRPDSAGEIYLADSVCYNAQKMAHQTNAAALITFTHSGGTVLKVSGYRPKSRIFAFTDNRLLQRQLSLVWGVDVIKANMGQSSDDFFENTGKYLKDHELIKKGDIIIHIGSIPVTEHMDTNMMKISIVD